MQYPASSPRALLPCDVIKVIVFRCRSTNALLQLVALYMKVLCGWYAAQRDGLSSQEQAGLPAWTAKFSPQTIPTTTNSSGRRIESIPNHRHGSSSSFRFCGRCGDRHWCRLPNGWYVRMVLRQSSECVLNHDNMMQVKLEMAALQRSSWLGMGPR